MQRPWCDLRLAAGRGNQRQVLFDLMAPRVVGNGGGEEGGTFGDGKAEAAGDVGTLGQPGAPPVVEAQNERQVEMAGAQAVSLRGKEPVRRPGTGGGLARETGKREGQDLVQRRVVGQNGLTPGANQRGDVRVGPDLAQALQGRRGEEQIAQMIGPDEQHTLRRRGRRGGCGPTADGRQA